MALPKYFVWGAATASYQVEGGIENCDWAAAARAGKVPECGIACDHYNRYEADFDLAKSMGHTAHRISIEWARIEPREGEFDSDAIRHYQDVLAALQKRDIEPFVTAWHFTLPDWFVARGGWLAPDSHTIFARYFAKIVGDLCAHCRHFATMNEPLVFTSNGYVQGSWPPFKKHSYITAYRIARALIRAHKAAYRKAKGECPASEIGVVKHNVYFHVSTAITNPFARLYYTIRKEVRQYIWNRYFLNAIQHDTDSIGINYYFHNSEGPTAQVFKRSDMQWDLYPEGLEHVLKEVGRYKKWVFVAEAGLADEHDTHRAWYIRELVAAIERAHDAGVDVRGFMYWSLLDNYEWACGFWPRFGLIAVDRETLARTPRPSAAEYTQILERHKL